MKITRFVPKVLFGVKAFDDLNAYIDECFPDNGQYTVYVIDSVHRTTGLYERLQPADRDLVQNAAIPKIAVPTLSGTGAEATRTAVLTGPVKKLGINSNFGLFGNQPPDSYHSSTVAVYSQVCSKKSRAIFGPARVC